MNPSYSIHPISGCYQITPEGQLIAHIAVNPVSLDDSSLDPQDTADFGDSLRRATSSVLAAYILGQESVDGIQEQAFGEVLTGARYVLDLPDGKGFPFGFN